MRCLSFLLIIALTISLTGCWDQIELNEVGLVMLLGIDTDPMGDGFETTVHVLDPQGMDENGSSGSSNVLVLSARGQTVLDSLRNLRGRVPFRLSFHHVRVIIIGEDLARKGIGPVIDFMTRTPEIRLTTYLLVSQGNASEIMTLPPEVSANLEAELEGLINVQDEWSKGVATRLFDILKGILDHGSHSVTGRILSITPRVTELETEVSSEESVEQDDIPPVVLLEGAAVFRDDKLVGWLTGTETIGYRYLTGEGGEMVLVVPYHSARISIELRTDASQVKYITGSSPPRFRVNMLASGQIVEYTGVIEFNDETIQQIEDIAAHMLRDLLYNAEIRAKELETDYIGYGAAISRQDPKTWQDLNKKWRETFPTVETEIQVKFNLKHTGTISSPIPH